MANVLEVESGVEEVEQPEVEQPEVERKKSGLKSMIEGTMKKSYVMGLSNGARAMCVSILAEIKKNEKRSIKKQVESIRQLCLKNMQKGEQLEENTDKEGE